MGKRPAADWDPRASSVLCDQRAAYDEMRERCPVAYSDFLGWSLFRHHDVVDVVEDPATYSSVSRHLAIPNGMDPPEHARYCAVLEPYFTPAEMATFEPRCRQIAEQLMRKLDGRQEVEFVNEYAEPFAMQALCAFAGWPIETWEYLRGWTHGNQEAALSRDRAVGVVLAREFAGYVEQAIRSRRERGAAPSQDITAGLMATSVEGQPLSDEAIVSILRNWTAGQGTVAAGLSILMFHLAGHSALQRRLRDDQSLVAAAVDEILRVDGPLVANRRTTTRDVEIGGRQIGAGENLTLMWIAADRDPHAFDEPEAVRLDRDQQGNLLFGAGIHYCVGAPLARLELRVALETLLARTSVIEIGTVAPPVRTVFPSNGMLALPLCLRP